jgi:hypothetical protein
MGIIRRVIAIVAVAGGLGISLMPVAAHAAQARLTAGTSSGLSRAAPRVRMPNCTPYVYPDYAHYSSTQPGNVSSHAYWTRGTCTKASVGEVVVWME